MALRFSTNARVHPQRVKSGAQLPFQRKPSPLHIALVVAAELAGLALLAYLIAHLI
ncbi:MAG: hypothetical protein ACXVRS_12240 [Gaiellaceae bacterium]